MLIYVLSPNTPPLAFVFVELRGSLLSDLALSPLRGLLY